MEASKGKNWAILNLDTAYIPDAPRKAAVTSFRLLTNHDCLRSNLFCIGFAVSPDCTLCDTRQPMIDEHLDVLCTKWFKLYYGKYWRARVLRA
ncbi:hypothetical protein CDAR_228381 [Caerostris darwini]|uniref:Uncharacterized protein n=1 Tax=Caerostris darwini TaxID=1538125 RepID=A0AAV4N7A1_9ARAC|nr:hypothetical protein CDAR_228381 [Caerostris darwini]